jgi:hypothetical protein
MLERIFQQGGGISWKCSLTCFIATALMMGIISTIGTVYLSSSRQKLDQSLSPAQKLAYRKVVVERNTIFTKSVGISIILAICVFQYLPKETRPCSIMAFLMTSFILLYVLTRKYHHALSFLEGRRQIGLWWDLQTSIQYSFYAGIGLTLIAGGLLWHTTLRGGRCSL